jgi:hypothetical protein
MPYFHATTTDRVASIQRHGLGGLRDAPKNFSISQEGTYLADDPMLALGFLLERALAGEWTHVSPPEALRRFVVFVIDDSRVDRKHLVRDDNVQMNGFWRYHGVIDVTAMPVVSADDVTRAQLGPGP